MHPWAHVMNKIDRRDFSCTCVIRQVCMLIERMTEDGDVFKGSGHRWPEQQQTPT